jgi:preprotein translocase subunit YajC
VIAANPGPAMHMALLGIVIVIGLIVFAIVRVRHKREAEAEKLDQTDAGNVRRPGAGHHHR